MGPVLYLDCKLPYHELFRVLIICYVLFTVANFKYQLQNQLLFSEFIHSVTLQVVSQENVHEGCSHALVILTIENLKIKKKENFISRVI